MRACAIASAVGVMGAKGFAAAKAMDPGAGAADSLEAQQPILVGKALPGAPRATCVQVLACVLRPFFSRVY